MHPAEHDTQRTPPSPCRASGVCLDAVAHAAGVGIGILSFNGRFKASNRRLCTLTGFKDSELKQKSLFSLCIEEHRDECTDMFEQLAMGLCDDFDLELRILRKDLLQRWVHVTANIIPDTRTIVMTMHDSSDYFELLQDMEETVICGQRN